MLDQYEKLHNKNSDERFNIITALLEKDEEAFHDSLEILVDEVVSRYADGGDLYLGTLEKPLMQDDTHNESQLRGLMSLNTLY